MTNYLKDMVQGIYNMRNIVNILIVMESNFIYILLIFISKMVKMKKDYKDLALKQQCSVKQIMVKLER